MEQKIVKRNDDTVWYITEYNNQGQQTSKTYYLSDGKTINYINCYNNQGQQTKIIWYYDDGKTIDHIRENNNNRPPTPEEIEKYTIK